MSSPLLMTMMMIIMLAATTIVHAHDDYLPLRQPEVWESPCVKRWTQMSAHFSTQDDTTRLGRVRRPLMYENTPSELHVNLTVRLDRFESRYVGFNTRTFNGHIPAPTIKVCPGDRLIVHVKNELGVGDANMTNLHLHGLHVSPKGHHDNVFKSIAPGDDRRYEYTIRPDHPPGSFWYHPHSHGLVNTQLSGLMAGSLIVVDRPGNYPEEIAQMDDLVVILQGICVENCHMMYDSIVHALNNDYEAMARTVHNASEMTMEREDEDEDDDTRQTARDEFPIDLRVEQNSPLNDTSLLHVYVNGQYLPEIHMKPGEFKRLRYLNAIANNVAEIVAPGCEMHLLARDGIYVDVPSKKDVVILPPGSRADVALRCRALGTFFVETESSPSRNKLLGKVNQHRVPSQKIVSLRVVSDESPREMIVPTELPKRPAYMQDLLHSTSPTSKYNYEFSVWMDDATNAMNFGVNRQKFDHTYVNHSMYVDEPQEWELSVKSYGHECAGMMTDMDHHSNLNFDTEMMLDQMEEHHASTSGEKKHGRATPHCHPMTHPFHMHGSHFQITRLDTDLDPEGLLFGLGEWRDTIPLFQSNVQIRFTPQHHMVGRILTHCHFAAHSDNGMAQLVEVRRR